MCFCFCGFFFVCLLGLVCLFLFQTQVPKIMSLSPQVLTDLFCRGSPTSPTSLINISVSTENEADFSKELGRHVGNNIPVYKLLPLMAI